MARGWESKAIEAQQDEAGRKGSKQGAPLTADQRATLQRRRTLQLARTRMFADLESATLERHRAMLQAAIADIDEQLRAL